MNAKKTEKREADAPNARIEADRVETDRLVAATRRDMERKTEQETDKYEASAESTERYVESIMDPDAVGDVDVRVEGALPADRVIGVSGAKVDKEARRLQVEATLDNKRAEARNRNASRYPFVDGEVEPDPYFKPMYDASARDPAAVNNTEAARVPNASHVGFASFEELEDEDDVVISARTREEMDYGAEVVGAREDGKPAPKPRARRKSRAQTNKQEREEAATA